MMAVNVVHLASCWWQCRMQAQTGLPAPLVLAESVTSGKNCSRNPGCRGHRCVSQASHNASGDPTDTKGIAPQSQGTAPLTLDEDVACSPWI